MNEPAPPESLERIATALVAISEHLRVIGFDLHTMVLRAALQGPSATGAAATLTPARPRR